MDFFDADFGAPNDFFDNDFLFSTPDNDSYFDLDFSQIPFTNEIENDSDQVYSPVIADQGMQQSPIMQISANQTTLMEQSGRIIHEPKKRRPKETITLTPQADMFKKEINLLFTHDIQKNARKELILKYHKMIYERYKFIRPAVRSEYRSINHYYNAFAPQAFFILRGFQELRAEGRLNYEEDYRALTQ